MLATMANELGMRDFHLDVSQAFVQAPLEEVIYMHLPPGRGERCKLLKYQYDLK